MDTFLSPDGGITVRGLFVFGAIVGIVAMFVEGWLSQRRNASTPIPTPANTEATPLPSPQPEPPRIIRRRRRPIIRQSIVVQAAPAVTPIPPPVNNVHLKVKVPSPTIVVQPTKPSGRAGAVKVTTHLHAPPAAAPVPTIVMPAPAPSSVVVNTHTTVPASQPIQPAAPSTIKMEVPVDVTVIASNIQTDTIVKAEPESGGTRAADDPTSIKTTPKSDQPPPANGKPAETVPSDSVPTDGENIKVGNQSGI